MSPAVDLGDIMLAAFLAVLAVEALWPRRRYTARVLAWALGMRGNHSVEPPRNLDHAGNQRLPGYRIDEHEPCRRCGPVAGDGGCPLCGGYGDVPKKGCVA